jgi:microcystin degradation protein MlrC
MSRRVALLGLMLESNRFAPVTTREDFLARLYLAGPEFLPELSKSESVVMAEMLGFCQRMTRNGDWQPAPILVGRVEAGGPIDHPFYAETIADMERRLRQALPLDAVYIANHGAMITTAIEDPDGAMFAMIRRVVGPSVPVLATLDLHANISEQMVEQADVIIAYRTNPHVDMIERGQEAADILREMWSGVRPHTAFIRLPLVAPTVTLLTAAGPYADVMNYAVSRIGGDVMTVSVVAGFAFADTTKNGMAILVTSRMSAEAAAAEAQTIASKAWDAHRSYQPRLTSLEAAGQRALAALADPSVPALIFADVADNPGGGGLGNTTAILRHFVQIGATPACLALFHDPDLVQDAITAGEGATFSARFNRRSAECFEVQARVERLMDGECVGRRGIYARRVMALGPTCCLDVQGIKVVVNSIRTQCADPVFFEMVGIDLAQARVVVVKSRGHFRSGFDEFFAHEQVVEVDGPGLSSPILSRFNFTRLPRPVYPLDDEVSWTPQLTYLRGATAQP